MRSQHDECDVAHRPRGFESRRRTKHLLALLSEGMSLSAAAKVARVDPGRVLRLLDEPEFRTVYVAISQGRANNLPVAA